MDDELGGFLAARGVAATARLSPLEGGEENDNRLIQDGGRRFVLRRYRWRGEADVLWELALVRHLVEHGFPTPASVGEPGWLIGRPAALFQFVPGRHPERESLDSAAGVARALAQLHELTAGLALPPGRTGGDIWRMERVRREIVDEGAHRGHPELPELVSRIDAFRGHFLERTARSWTDLPTAVVHHDAHAGNVLFDETGRLVALLDFDMAHVAPRVSELASLIHSWASEPYPSAEIDWAHARGVVEAYGPLSASECEVLPYVIGLYYIADAADYVRNRLARNPAYMAVSGCSMYRRFGVLTGAADWADLVRERLVG